MFWFNVGINEADTVPVLKLLAFNEVKYVPVPTRLALMLPIVTAFKVVATTVPLNVPPANVGVSVVRKFCGLLIVIVLPLAVAVIPLVLANVNVPPPDTEPVPLVPDKLTVVLTDCDVNATIRP